MPVGPQALADLGPQPPGPMAQQGWFFGGEKRSAVGSGGYQYDYAGEIAEVRFWTALAMIWL